MPSKTGRAGLLLFALLALCGCAYELIRKGAINEPRAAEVEAGIQKIRELSFKSPVPIVVEGTPRAEQDLIAELEREYSDDRLMVEGQAGALLGLFPADIRLKSANIDLLKSQVAGFYDPHRKEMILIEGTTDLGIWNSAAEFMMQRDLVGEMLLAHELTHALQDQYFGLEGKLDRLKNDDDRALALKSLAEGDATLAGFGYVSGGMNQGTVDLLASRLSDLPRAFAAKAGSVPEGLSTPLLFQYSAGVRFVGEAFRRGGWQAVNALYLDPPQSSRQILHPELYFDHAVPPVEVKLGGYQSALGGWSNADENTLGEVLLQVILKRNLGEERAGTELADRWAGDRMIVLRKGNSLTLVWCLVFDDSHSAAHFAAVYTGVLDRLLGQATPHRLDYKADAVLVLVGESARHFRELAPAIWVSTRFDRAQPKAVPASAKPQPSALPNA